MIATILVVDDEAANRALLEELLAIEGYAVVTAANGRMALVEFARVKPDLVLLDVMMPQLDGFEVCKLLKRDRASRLTPVVLVTGLAAKADRIRGIEAGADDFLNKPVDRSELLARVGSLVKLKRHTDELECAEAVLFALARSIEAKDPYTEGHCERLSDFANLLGERVGLSADLLIALRRAGIVHDLGKVAVPDAVLLKAGPLNQDEWTIMRQHPAIGEKICAPLRSFRDVLPIIRNHHERFDGSGYPDGLQGSQIPLTARILAIVDVYDALTTDRPYHKAVSPQKALTILQEEAGRGWWDRSLVEEFRVLVEESTLCTLAH